MTLEVLQNTSVPHLESIFYSVKAWSYNEHRTRESLQTLTARIRKAFHEFV